MPYLFCKIFKCFCVGLKHKFIFSIRNDDIFFQKPISAQDEDVVYLETKGKVLLLRALNNTPKIAVTLIKDFHGLLTAKEKQMQFLHYVQKHRNVVYSDCKEKTDCKT